VAQQVETRLVDDLDGSQADETVSFALDGKSYEIDLAKKNAAELRKAVADFVSAARRSGSGRQRSAGGARGRQRSTDRQSTTAIREWARQHGYTVADRGRIPSTVLAAYEKGTS
jgi:hypothetical protein